MTEEKANFLNEKQDDLKQKLIHECVGSIFDSVKNNILIFDNLQQVLDFHFSVLIIVNREILTHLFKTSNTVNQRGKVMRNLFETIRQEVNLRIRDAA